MSLAAHTIKSPKNARRSKKRVGRGNASQKGTYAGRGMKGQRARSGGKSGTAYIGFKQSLKKIPKLRGFKSIHPKAETVTLGQLEQKADAGMVVTPKKLEKMGIISRPQNGVKIVVRGKLTKALTIKGCVASKGALEAIEKAGGNVIA